MKREFGETLKRRRLGLGLSMGQVARALGISVVHYSRVENGKEHPFPSAGKVDYEVLAKLLGADAAELLALAHKERPVLRLHASQVTPRELEVSTTFLRWLATGPSEAALATVEAAIERCAEES